MIAADRPGQRSPSSRLLVVDARGEIVHARRAALVDFLRPATWWSPTTPPPCPPA